MNQDGLQIAVVENLAYRGLGVVRHKGKVVFLPFTAAGDHVRFGVVKEFTNHSLGVVQDVVKEGRGRTEPRCAFYGRCGGCHLQHVKYEDQLRWKERWVRDALERIGGIRDDVVHTIVGSPEPFAYRNKASLHVRRDAIGFFAAGSDEVIDIDSCPVLIPVVESALRAVRRWMGAHGGAGESFRLVLRVGEQGDGLAVLHTSPARIENLDELKKAIPGFRIGCAGLSDTVTYRAGAIEFRVSAGAFFQVNSLLHGRMTELVRGLAGRGNHLLDGHAGVGWPSLCLAHQFMDVTAVEISRSAKSLAVKNARAAGISNINFLGGTLYSVRKGRILDSKPDVVLLDPPRSGLRAQDLQSVVSLEPERIIYISCDPPTLARDIRRFQSDGFSVEAVQPIDLFPQTYHVETIALLSRC
jgi:23S rRNA (uracil1939-C5)-methyltransferase